MNFFPITPPERSALPFCVGRIRLWTHIICRLNVLNHFVKLNIQLSTSNECLDAISIIAVIFSIVIPWGAIDEVSKSLWFSVSQSSAGFWIYEPNLLRLGRVLGAISSIAYRSTHLAKNRHRYWKVFVLGVYPVNDYILCSAVAEMTWGR